MYFPYTIPNSNHSILVLFILPKSMEVDYFHLSPHGKSNFLNNQELKFDNYQKGSGYSN
jgi:hypothetical protein